MIHKRKSNGLEFYKGKNLFLSVVLGTQNLNICPMSMDKNERAFFERSYESSCTDIS